MIQVMLSVTLKMLYLTPKQAEMPYNHTHSARGLRILQPLYNVQKSGNPAQGLYFIKFKQKLP